MTSGLTQELPLRIGSRWSAGSRQVQHEQISTYPLQQQSGNSACQSGWDETGMGKLAGGEGGDVKFTRPGKLTHNYGKIHHFFKGKSTIIFITIFNSYVNVYQRVIGINFKWC